MAPQASLGNILVVDDDLTVTDLLRLNLRSEGYNVLVKTSTADVSAADLRNVHLMLVDGAGQTPSGIDLISELKATPAGQQTGFCWVSLRKYLRHYYYSNHLSYTKSFNFSPMYGMSS